MTRGFILSEREREKESVSACVLACSFTIQSFGRSLYVALLGNRDGSDPSAHLRNMTRFFFFRISSEMGVHN